MSESFILVYLAIVGVMLLVGLVSVLFTLPKVKSHWKPVYWMATGVATSLSAAFVFSTARILAPELVHPLSVSYTLLVALAILSLKLVLWPYIHRREMELENSYEHLYVAQSQETLEEFEDRVDRRSQEDE